MPKLLLLLILFMFAFAGKSFAQDTLPNILVKNYNGRIVISWKNAYGARISTINIQRSADSIRNFTTIATVLSPMNKQNGVVDTKAPATNLFYRVFVGFEGGTYVYSKSHRPVIDTMKTEPAKPTTITTAATVITTTPVAAPPKEIKPPAPPAYVYGRFVFTGRDNNVILKFPEAATHKYCVKFFDEKENQVFEIKSVPETYLILDKVNFMHSGWFNYQIFDNGVLMEKYRLFIPKDGR